MQYWPGSNGNGSAQREQVRSAVKLEVPSATYSPSASPFLTVASIVTVPGPGGGPIVRVFDAMHSHVAGAGLFDYNRFESR